MNWFKYIIILIGSSTLAMAQTELFEKANTAYNNEQYDKAASLYEHMLEEGYVSTNIYYNLANAYFKTDDLGKSILYYEKAQKLSPQNEDVVHNLRFAYAQTVDQIEPLPPLFFINWWRSLLSTNTASTWGIYGAISLWLALFIWLAYYIMSKRMLKYVGIGVFIIGLVLLSLAFAKNSLDKSNKHAVVLSEQVTLRNSPNTDAENLGVIHEGLKVRIKDHVDDWYKISLQDGNVAWINKNSVAVI